MRIEVRKSDAFTMGGGSLFFYREGACYAIRTNGSVDIVPYERTSNEYDIPHALAFELMKCMGHDPMYVDEAESEQVKIADPDPYGHTEAWLAVTDTLDELVPDWLSNNLSGMDAACAAIRALHAKDNGTVAVPSPDPHAEWREAVTEFIHQWNKWAQHALLHDDPRMAAATRVIEAAERAKSVTGDGKGGAA